MKCANPLHPIQHDFLIVFPYDIVNNILTRLTQSECLECMAVSTVWYNWVPLYATQLWRSVSFMDYPLTNMRMLKCLGPHVQNAHLAHCSEEQAHAILATLFHRNCTLHNIEFFKCVLVDQLRLVAALRRISNVLKSLTFIEHNYNMAFIKVMESCPQLTHFSYSVNSYAPPEVYDTEPLPLTASPDLNITYLRLDAVLCKNRRTLPILKKCPKLTHLLIGNIEADSDFHMWPADHSIDLDLFLHHCPNIQHLRCNAPDLNRRITRPIHHPGVKEFITRTAKGYNANQILPFVRAHAPALQILSLDDGFWTDDSDWTPLSALPMPQLDTFSCKYLKFPATTLSSFLQHCSVLTHVTLWCMQEISDQVLAALHALPLSQLDMGVNSTTSLPSEQSWCLFFANAKLKSLCLRWGSFVTDQVLDAICEMDGLNELTLLHTARNATRLETLGRLKGLKRLELWSVQAPLDQVLLDMWWVEEFALVHCPTVTNAGLRVLVDSKKSLLSQLRIEHCRLIHLPTIEYVQQKIESVQFR